MASALVNNVGMGPEAFLDCCPPTAAFGWLSPRISFSRDFAEEEKTPPSKVKAAPTMEEAADLDDSREDIVLDFEFRLDDPVMMLPADELFSDGKLVPLQLAPVRQQEETPAVGAALAEVQSSEPQKLRRAADINGSVCDQYVFSPKAPRCSSRWRELLGFKRAVTAASQSSKQDQKTASAPPSTAPTTAEAPTASTMKSTNPRSLKHFLHRSSKSSTSSSSIDSSSLSLPLLRDSESESISISSRLSLSSSSSGPEHDDLPRLSLDFDKPTNAPLSLGRQPPRLRISKPRPSHDPPSRPLRDQSPARIGRTQVRRAPDAAVIPSRGASVDSPRMNSCGRVVFQGLERSSSSPSTFNGGPRAKPRGMERSYSANVRITPVLNVPVCSLRGSSKSGSVFGFGQLFSPQRRDSGHSAVAARASTTVTSGGGGNGTRCSGRVREGVLGN